MMGERVGAEDAKTLLESHRPIGVEGDQFCLDSGLPWPCTIANLAQTVIDQAAEIERLSWELARCVKDRRKLVDGAMRTTNQQADAWDEGFTKAGRLITGLDDEPWPPAPNPYRKTVEVTSNEQ